MIQAKIHGKWGPLPVKMQEQVPIPEDGESKDFEFLYSYTDGMTKKKAYKNQEGLMSIVKVINPETKQPIEIGLVGGIDQNGNPLPYEIRRVSFYPQATGGLHHITIGSSGDANETYQFMMMTSENQDSPFRDKSVPAIFKNKDFKVEANARTEARRLRRDAMSHAMKLTGSDLVRAAFLLSLPAAANPEILLDDVIEFADKNAKVYFERIVDDKNAEAKATVAEAIQRGVAKIDVAKSRIVWSNEAPIIELTQTEPEQAINEFADYIASNKAGKTVLDKMKQLIKTSVSTEATVAKVAALGGATS